MTLTLQIVILCTPFSSFTISSFTMLELFHHETGYKRVEIYFMKMLLCLFIHSLALFRLRSFQFYYLSFCHTDVLHNITTVHRNVRRHIDQCYLPSFALCTSHHVTVWTICLQLTTLLQNGHKIVRMTHMNNSGAIFVQFMDEQCYGAGWIHIHVLNALKLNQYSFCAWILTSDANNYTIFILVSS